MIKKVINYFDKLEDRARSRLSRFPVLYAFVGGLGIVLFWHSVTEMAMAIPFLNEWNALPWFVISMIMLLVSGIFVSYFVGDQLIMSGLKGEKKMIEKSQDEIVAEEKEEEKDIIKILAKLETLEQKLDAMAKQK